jgi:hypothetical protein
MYRVCKDSQAAVLTPIVEIVELSVTDSADLVLPGPGQPDDEDAGAKVAKPQKG